MERLRLDSEGMADLYLDMENTYRKSDIKKFRRGHDWSEEFFHKLLENVTLVAAKLFYSHPKIHKLPIALEAPNTLIFRFSLCMNLLVLDWILGGSPRTLKAERVRNDHVDMMIAAYATFFDGVISSDRKLCRIHSQACAALHAFRN